MKSESGRQPQTWISLCSTFIAVLALAFSMYQAWLQRQFVRLSILPKITTSFFYNEDGAGYMFGGTGIGYANLKTFEVLVDGTPQPNWLEVCRAVGLQAVPAFQFVVVRPETFFKPDSYNKIFWIPAGPLAEELKQKASHIRIQACYCSLYEECWKADSRGGPPIPVSACKEPEITFGSPPRPVRLPTTRESHQ